MPGQFGKVIKGASAFSGIEKKQLCSLVGEGYMMNSFGHWEVVLTHVVCTYRSGFVRGVTSACIAASSILGNDHFQFKLENIKVCTFQMCEKNQGFLPEAAGRSKVLQNQASPTPFPPHSGLQPLKMQAPFTIVSGLSFQAVIKSAAGAASMDLQGSLAGPAVRMPSSRLLPPLQIQGGCASSRLDHGLKV